MRKGRKRAQKMNRGKINPVKRDPTGMNRQPGNKVTFISVIRYSLE